MKNILFVCMGNICRSPAIEAVFRKLLKEKGVLHDFALDSCSTTSWYVGQQADARMRTAARRHGVEIDHIAQLFEPYMFEEFDYILAVDQDVLEMLLDFADTPAKKAKIRLLGDFSSKYPKQGIPDPFYGGPAGFEKVMDMIEDICQGLLAFLLK